LAAAAFEQALKLAPDHIEALRGLGDVALLEEQHDAAASRYERILAVDPGDAGAMTKLGVLKMRAQRPDDAIALFRRAVEREPQNAEALPFFERALAVGPRSSMALNGLALTKLALGDRAGAAKAFKESLALDPKQPDVARTLAELGGAR